MSNFDFNDDAKKCDILGFFQVKILFKEKQI
jgi:hypothetical protein